MPSPSEKIRLPETLDRRRKLTSEQYEEIQRQYTKGYSLRALGRMYGVDKSTIGYIVNPVQREKLRQRGKEHWQDYATDKESRNATMREHRAYKRNLYKEGLLQNEYVA